MNTAHTIFALSLLAACVPEPVDSRGASLACGDATCPSDRIVFVAGDGDVARFLTLDDLGGVAGADSLCSDLAGKAGLGTGFRAWLSTEKVGAAERLLSGPGRYVLVDGTPVAESWAALTSSDLLAPINLTQDGVAVEAEVWTGTQADGSPGSACDGWTNAKGFATHGRTTVAGPAWTSHGELQSTLFSCTEKLSVYCIEAEVVAAALNTCDAACKDAEAESFYTECGPGCDRCYNLLSGPSLDDLVHYNSCSEDCTVGDPSTCPQSDAHPATCRKYPGGTGTGVCLLACGKGHACPDGMACIGDADAVCVWDQS